MSDKERWKDVKGFEGIYKISNKGRIKVLRRWKVNLKKYEKCDKILTPTDNGYGYLIIRLNKRGVKKNKYIHRLVAEHFIDNPKNLPVVNHLDYDKKNNDVSNLEWCTQQENVRHSIVNMHKRRTVTHTNTGERYISFSKKRNKYRICVDRKEYPSVNTLEEAIKVRDRVLKGVV